MLWGNSAGAPLLEKAVYFDEELPYCSEDLAPPKTKTASLPHLTKKRLNCLEGFFFFSDCVGCSLLWGVFSNCNAWTSNCSGFSCC